MVSPALILLLVVAALAGALFWPALYASAFRQKFRSWPGAREAFVGSGSWIAFSRRFGRSYAIGALMLAVVWFFLGGAFLPETGVGAWLLFGPAMLLITVGVALGALVICRWIADEP